MREAARLRRCSAAPQPTQAPTTGNPFVSIARLSSAVR
jgi:hypothetical protein